MSNRLNHSSLPPQMVHRLDDPVSGLSGVIVIHSTRLGPAAGGCRLWSYPGLGAAIADATRLAEGMSYKNALAGLPLGGGKAVIDASGGISDRAALFRAFGRAVESLGGRYVTAEDVGTTVADMLEVAAATRHVAGLPAQDGRPGGDPSPHTARGVFVAMQAAAARHLGTSLDGLTVAVQGLGNVGKRLCGLLHEAGARLIVAETRPGVAAELARHYGAAVCDPAEIVVAEADIFAPCALGGVLDSASIAGLRARMVCGGANNVLATPEVGALLADRGILYCPDYVVNAGGIINVAAEYLGWSEAEVSRRVGETGARLIAVLDHAEAEGVPPNLAADRMAQAMVAPLVCDAG